MPLVQLLLSVTLMQLVQQVPLLLFVPLVSLVQLVSLVTLVQLVLPVPLVQFTLSVPLVQTVPRLPLVLISWAVPALGVHGCSPSPHPQDQPRGPRSHHPARQIFTPNRHPHGQSCAVSPPRINRTLVP